MKKAKFILLMSVILISLLFCSCESTEALKEAEDAMPESGNSEESMTTEQEKYTDKSCRI